MELIRPDFGLLFWMLVSFGIVLLILRAFAWKPILNALKNREKTIQERLEVARNAKKELAEIEFGNERIIALAKTERANILREAQETKNKIIEEAREEARKEASKIIEQANKRVEKQKKEAEEDIKNQIAGLSVQIAEKVLKERLSDDQRQKEYINSLVNEITIN
ncbi:MAG: F0F1 ATP synthase subunit B [Bacteroidales bacterium]|nr:F0F1 ATP synthase subunit B [Bacteroidales bacterium]